MEMNYGGGRGSISRSRGSYAPRGSHPAMESEEHVGCWAWFRRKADDFRDLLSGTCCACFEAIPSIGLMVLALVLLFLLLGSIPLAVMLTYMAPAAQRAPQPDTHSIGMVRPVQHVWNRDEFVDDSDIIKSMDLLPRNMSGCRGFGFACTSHPDMIIGTNQRCDGNFDCPDGSDELDCRECQTSFSCPTQNRKSSRKTCIRGHAMCDNKPDCGDMADELLYCNRRCEDDEYHCKSKDRCLPLNFVCDGDAHCPDMDDEVGCKECVQGALMCNVTGMCVPKWKQCNGVADCPDGSDELGCDCRACSGSNNALCDGPEKMCVLKRNVCDGIQHCPNNEDEAQCPGSCSPERLFQPRLQAHQQAEDATRRRRRRDIEGSQVEFEEGSASGDDDHHNNNNNADVEQQPRFRVDEADLRLEEPVASLHAVLCHDAKTYDWKYACSGLYPQCDGRCESCNTEMAFQCEKQQQCIHRNYVCDGKAHCADGSDEKHCDCRAPGMITCSSKSFSGEERCYAQSQKCDGFGDCRDGEDEQQCTECVGDAFLCKADHKCITSTSRCDGVEQCSDGEDERDCSCAECQSHPFPMYMCERAARCFRLHNVCDPRTRCPDPTKMDKLYCATRQKPYF